MVYVLDKGFVKMMKPTFSMQDIRVFGERGFDKQKLLRHIHVSMTVKCPLFVKGALPEFGLMTATQRHKVTELYVPTISDIQCGDHSVARDMVDDIKATGEALMINPKSYRHDGCEKSVSQILTPVALYNTVIVSGQLLDWISFIECDKFPALIEEYRKAIHALIMTEYQEVLNAKAPEQNATDKKV